MEVESTHHSETKSSNPKCLVVALRASRDKFACCSAAVLTKEHADHHHVELS